MMDDGWFGDKYPRMTDNSSLGDWVVDKNKLPNGVPGLVANAKKHGIKFGIWIEPEMEKTFDKLGIPLEERLALSGTAVDAIMYSLSPFSPVYILLYELLLILSMVSLSISLPESVRSCS